MYPPTKGIVYKDKQGIALLLVREGSWGDMVAGSCVDTHWGATVSWGSPSLGRMPGGHVGQGTFSPSPSPSFSLTLRRGRAT